MRQRTPRGKNGFTLVEILVVIGIIVILIGVLVPMVARAMRQAKKTRTAADMQSISTALQAFKDDFGDYPRTETVNSGAAMLGRYLNGPFGDGVTSTGTADNTDPPTHNASTSYLPGDAVESGGNLYVALIPNTAVSPPNVNTWAQCNNLRDGLDGPGLQPKARGKKYGPYMSADKIAMRGVCFVDFNGSPILYFPARVGKGGPLTAQGVYVNRSSGLNPAVAGAGDPKNAMKYDADDNFEVFRRSGEADGPPLNRIRAMLGDYDGDGTVETAAGEKIVTEAPFLLWSAGADGKFGPDTPSQLEADRCDDVMNFR